MLPAIKVRNISKNFLLPHERHSTLKAVFTNILKGGRRSKTVQHALRDVSFDVQPGEFFGIVGRNGSGKSTMLKLLAHIYQPSSGSINIHGKLVPFIELGVGFNPELSGRDNVYLSGALLGFSTSEIDRQYDDIVQFAELEKFMDQKLKNYSSGMQVRLAFSLATRADSDILLIDEVLAVGDADFQQKCFRYFKELKRQGKTVVFVSHDMNAVREFCDKGIVINNGKLVFSGTADQIADEYTHIMNQHTGPAKKNADSNRWGDGSIKIGKPDIKTSRQELVISSTLTATNDCDNVVTGMGVYAPDGKPVLGTNSILLKKKIKPLLKGESIAITWRIPNIFKDGAYRVDMTCHGYSGLPVYDWWESAVRFETHFDRNSPYTVEPDVEFEVSGV